MFPSASSASRFTALVQLTRVTVRRASRVFGLWVAPGAGIRSVQKLIDPGIAIGNPVLADHGNGLLTESGQIRPHSDIAGA
jgi:hypothetical protein